jgi:hypothetical protein
MAVLKDFFIYLFYLYGSAKNKINSLIKVINNKPISLYITDENYKVYYPLISIAIFPNMYNLNLFKAKTSLKQMHLWYLYHGQKYCCVIDKEITSKDLLIKKNKKYRNKLISASYLGNDIDYILLQYGGPDGNYYNNNNLKGANLRFYSNKKIIYSDIGGVSDNKIIIMNNLGVENYTYNESTLI